MNGAHRDFPPLLREPEHPASPRRRILYGLLAGVCFVAGVFGWLVPVVTGIPFYVAGLVFLGLASGHVRDWLNRLECRLPWKVRHLLRRGARHLPRRLQTRIDPGGVEGVERPDPR